jgi:hypothetical protein
MQTECIGSSAVERRYAKAEARVQFPADALKTRSDNSTGRVPVFQTGGVGSSPTHCLNVSREAAVAQRVEQSSRKRPIAGSIPACGSFEDFGCVAQRQSRGLISLRLLVRIQPFTHLVDEIQG